MLIFAEREIGNATQRRSVDKDASNCMLGHVRRLFPVSPEINALPEAALCGPALSWCSKVIAERRRQCSSIRRIACGPAISTEAGIAFLVSCCQCVSLFVLSMWICPP